MILNCGSRRIGAGRSLCHSTEEPQLCTASFFSAFPDVAIVATLSQQLSWSHFGELLPLKRPLQRECCAEMFRIERWSVRALGEGIDSMFYERTALSRRPGALIERELDGLRDAEWVTPDLRMRDAYTVVTMILKRPSSNTTSKRPSPNRSDALSQERERIP
jgi:hypothetical protein